ncbi:MAG: NFACT family protein, partial [Clostridia bacterium]|nr:NFACT family protein [Clostridia bacterium]
VEGRDGAPDRFLVALRRHLEGGVVRALRQDGLDRVVRLEVEKTDELGDRTLRTLVAELMGPRSNLVLCDGRERVVDALRRHAPAAGGRTILPGHPYAPPPAAAGTPLDRLEGERFLAAWAARMGDRGDGSTPVWRRVVDLVAGLGPVLAREACIRSGLDPDASAAGAAADAPALVDVLLGWAELVRGGSFEPALHAGRRGRLPLFAAFPLSAWAGPTVLRDSANRVARTAFGAAVAAAALEDERHRLRQALRAHAERVRRKLADQRAELAEMERAEDLRVAGELLSASIHLVPAGASIVELPDYYGPPGATRRIPLDPALGPAANAQRYFRAYQKARRGLPLLRRQVEEAEELLRYLEELETQVEVAEDAGALALVAEEAEAAGVLPRRRPAAGRGGRVRPDRDASAGRTVPRPLAFLSRDGLTILVGRNARENEYLALRLGQPDDLWLHVKDLPGSHVLVRAGGGPVPETTVADAAQLAAYYSKARQSSRVPVDVTLCRHVRKVPGGRPGHVLYDHHRTVFVTPTPEAVDRLRRA